MKEDIEMGMMILVSSLDYINNMLSESKYLWGEDPTIADISAFCEIIEIPIIGVDYTKFSNINRWMNELLKIKEFMDSSLLVVPFVKEYLKNVTAKM